MSWSLVLEGSIDGRSMLSKPPAPCSRLGHTWHRFIKRWILGLQPEDVWDLSRFLPGTVTVQSSLASEATISVRETHENIQS